MQTQQTQNRFSGLEKLPGCFLENDQSIFCNKIGLVAFSKSIKAHLENEIFCRSGKYNDFRWDQFTLTEGKMFYNYSTLREEINIQRRIVRSTRVPKGDKHSLLIPYQ